MILKKLQQFRKEHRGATMLEFALIAPIYLFTILGIIELGIVMLTAVILEGAVGNAARVNITGVSGAEETRAELLQRIVNEDSVGLLKPEKLLITADVYVDFEQLNAGNPLVLPGVPINPGGAGQLVLIQARYNWSFLTPIFSSFGGETLNLQSNAIVKNEPF